MLSSIKIMPIIIITYCLTSFKYLCNEVTYVTQYLTNTIDIEKVYMSSDWEEKLCEKIIGQN